MPGPGYQPGGWWEGASGLTSWETSPPPKLHAALPSYIPAIALGFGMFPRYSRVTYSVPDEAIRVKEF